MIEEGGNRTFDTGDSNASGNTRENDVRDTPSTR